MFKRKCACGETEKSFKIDIGPFFVNECCEQAGYDVYGKTEADYKKEENEQEEEDRDWET